MRRLPDEATWAWLKSIQACADDPARAEERQPMSETLPPEVVQQIADARKRNAERCGRLHGYPGGQTDKLCEACSIWFGEECARLALQAHRCDCGSPLTQCSDCAVGDYQSQHLECRTCAPVAPEPREERPR